MWKKLSEPFEYVEPLDIRPLNLLYTDFMIATPNGWQTLVVGDMFQKNCVYKLKPWTQERTINWLRSNRTCPFGRWPQEIKVFVRDRCPWVYCCNSEVGFRYSDLEQHKIYHLLGFQQLPDEKLPNFGVKIFCDNNGVYRFIWSDCPMCVTNARSIKGFIGYQGKDGIHKEFQDGDIYVVFKE